jgi:glucose-1-phosphate cytidylyltransferase
MKVVILAGGYGTRLTEETESKPKPMVAVGAHPILWHILKHYAHYGHNEFLLALGYKGAVIKQYFRDYYSLGRDMSVATKSGEVLHHGRESEDWMVQLVDTGVDVMTGGRVKRLQKYIGKDTFLLTYGDGVCDVDIGELVRFHKKHGRIATVTAVRPPARFGGLVFDGDLVKEFTEKPQIGEGWINGGFMVFEPGIFEYLDGDKSVLESDALERLAEDGQLAAYRHERFWQCVDTLRDLRTLEGLWQAGNPPWKVWKD